MNSVEIADAVSDLFEAPFDAESFPYEFLAAYGNKPTTIRRLKSKKNSTNQSDLPGGLLQRNIIHLAVCEEGHVPETLDALRESPATTRHKVKFTLATDGKTIAVEELSGEDPKSYPYEEFPEHFGFLLTLAGISAVKPIRENAFDIRATSRLNRLYVELLKVNPDWSTTDRREALNHFMARLIFCFFAEDTGIFAEQGLFTDTADRMSESDASNTHEVLSEIFRTMRIPHPERDKSHWTNAFPYVNGGLFSDDDSVPRFSRIARAYLLKVGHLDWKQINPDIFGSMIQAVADEKERVDLGMHYTSVPNILKVLNPLFLDDLRTQLEAAADNGRKLLNLRRRLEHIRVFDPACGSGNFLVIAYREVREIEAEINKRRGEPNRRSSIPLTNYRGIELRHFSAEIARLALIIAEYQCDVRYRGEQLAMAEFLPLKDENWITCGNALALDWLSVCRPTGKTVKLHANDLFATPLKQAEIDFKNEGGETYLCGNPPYRGATLQSKEQKADLKRIFAGRTKQWKSLDYVSGWFMKAADYGMYTKSAAAFVSTNSICQGQQVPILWPLIFRSGHEIAFAHTSFKWANLASYNAGVTVVIVGISNHTGSIRQLFSIEDNGETLVRGVENVNAYLVAGRNIVVSPQKKPISDVSGMVRGNIPVDGGNLYLSTSEKVNQYELDSQGLVRLCLGGDELINGKIKYCLWLNEATISSLTNNVFVKERLARVSLMRTSSTKKATRTAAAIPHLFVERRQTGNEQIIAIPAISSENREYLPVGLMPIGSIISGKMYGIFDSPIWNMALIASRLHLVWIGTVCVRMRTDFSYSNTLGWNTFPVPVLTHQNKLDFDPLC